MSYKQLGCFAGILGGASIAASFALSQPLHAEPTRKPTAPVRKPVVPARAKTFQSSGSAAAASPGLEVKFDGLRDSQGQVCLSLFSGPTQFPSDSSPDLLVKRCAPVSSQTASILLGDLKPGDYAITAFHDANKDSKLNKGSFGIPEEGFGFSNNPEIGFSAPSFTETKFKVSNAPAKVQIKFRYMK
ncbi:DUF2141 domain-containing protein [Altericista sp. CCNU0014]|uniref:DUF2141 domain-containing protein n=1 Tax=Altericista sp. CCNU0014 TaxID=3082949 RepID=UPI00384F39A2